MAVREFLEKVAVMISPVMPHVAEEFWHELGRSTLVVKEQWPLFDESMINEGEEAIEELIDSTASDIRKGLELTSKIPANSGKRAREIRVIIAEDWKTEAYNALAREKNLGKALAMPSLAGVDKAKSSKFLSQFAKRLGSLVAVPDLKAEDILKGFSESSKYLSERLGAQVSAIPESESRSDRAQRALPGKPAIDIIWE
jgi:leucyl-tRNA synthetase